MADTWKTVSLANIIPTPIRPPDGTLFVGIQTIIETIQTALGGIQTVLNAASKIAGLLSLLDLAALIRKQLEDFKREFQLAGFYACNMFDYPVKQLSRKDGYGPEFDYKSLSNLGQSFATSFVADLIGSFNDTYDPARPRFSGDCAMIVVVTGAPELPSLPIGIGEDNLAGVFAGMSQSIGDACKLIHRLRLTAALSFARQAAEEQQETTKTASRVAQVVRAARILAQLTDEEIGQVMVETDTLTGLTVMDKQATDMNWELDIEPVVALLENQLTASTYPNWSRISMKDLFPIYPEVIDTIMDPLIALFQTADGIAQQIANLVKAIQNKIDLLTDIIDTINDVINKFNTLLLAGNFSVLYIVSNTGIQGLVSKLQSATAVPFTGDNFYSGIALLSGGPQVTAFKSIFGPIAG